MNFFDHKRPRKSSHAVMSTSRETPCRYSAMGRGKQMTSCLLYQHSG